MKKTMIGLPLVVLLYLGVSYWLGAIAERQYRVALAEATANQALKLESRSYERGLFVSRAVTEVEVFLDPDAEQATPDLAFATRDEIFHGPLPLAALLRPDVPFRPALALVRQTFAADNAEWARPLAEQPGGEAPVQALTEVGFDGRSVTKIAAPRVSLEDLESTTAGGRRMLWDARLTGLRGRVERSPADATQALTLSLDEAELVAKEGNGSGARHEARTTLSALSVQASQRMSSGGFALGEVEAAVERLAVELPDESKGPLTLDDLVLEVASRESAGGEGYIDVEEAIRVGRAALGDQSGSGDLKLTLGRLDRVQLLRLQEIASEQSQSAQGRDAMASEVLDLTRAVLRGRPEGHLETSIQLEQGNLQGTLSIKLQDLASDEDFDRPLGLIGLLDQASMDLGIDQGLAAYLADTAGASQEYERLLDRALSSDLIRLEDERLTTAARFDQGQLEINGQPIPLPIAPAPRAQQGDGRDAVPPMPSRSGEDPGSPDESVPAAGQ